MAWAIPNVISPARCRELLVRAQSSQWLDGTVNTAEGRQVRPKIRSNDVALLNDTALAAELLASARPSMPETMKTRALFGLGPKMRLYRYRPGAHFGPHHDQFYTDPSGRVSELTFFVFLNDDFRGGQTHFLDLKQTFEPRAGTAVVFQHTLLHEGCVVEAGTKYILRTDVYYGDAAG